MRTTTRDSILVKNRQRSSIDPRKREELRDSILSKALLHPPVLRTSIPPEPPGYVLVAGETRLAAIDSIAKDGLAFRCDDTVVMPGEVPFVFLTDLTDIGYREAELEENLIRSDLPWQDRCLAIAEIHRMRAEANPDQTPTDTARELAEKGGTVGINEAASVIHHPDVIRTAIIQSKIIAEHISDPQVANARNANEAFAHITRTLENQHVAELTRRRLAAAPTKTDFEIRHGDSRILLPQLESGVFDLILSDPPYGIGAGSSGFRSRTVHHHNYEDTPDSARELCKIILMEGFRVTKPRANIFLFASIDLWFWLREFSKQCGWTPFPTPVIWQKSESEGLAPWGQQGFRRTYDNIFFATKGQRGLIHSPTDILSHKRVGRSDRVYAAEKPEGLLRTLIEASTLPGEYLLDPCAGSGSTIGAARIAPTRRALGIEIDKSAFDLALIRANEDRSAPEPAGPVSESPVDLE
jgi:site-specific DNA-methyltransferase (adenine-specific)